MFNWFSNLPLQPKVLKSSSNYPTRIFGLTSAKSHIPKWYKGMAQTVDGKPLGIDEDSKVSNKGIKYCVPFLDAMMSGYVAELWQDVQVTQGPHGPNIVWQSDPDVVHVRAREGMEGFPAPNGYWDNHHFVWRNPYCIQTPPGYSILITHPLNRFDLPFITLSGIVDAEDGMGPGNVPFYLSKDFEGIIPRGTPIFQVLPFKRENWTGEHSEEVSKLGDLRAWESLSRVSGEYKNHYWKKKKYD